MQYYTKLYGIMLFTLKIYSGKSQVMSICEVWELDFMRVYIILLPSSCAEHLF